MALLTPSRRGLLHGGGALFAWSLAPRLASAAGARDSRFIVVLLRGALDGLAAVPPLGDPGYAAVRGDFVHGAGEAASGKLDSTFSLNARLPEMARLYAARELLVVHAVASPYRERSHFDAQDVLESGAAAPHALNTGWLNRMVAELPASSAVRGGPSLAVGVSTPLVLRGSAPITGWAPAEMEEAAPDLYDRVQALYRQNDPVLDAALRAARSGGGGGAHIDAEKTRVGRARQDAERIARMVAKPDGPRVAAMALYAWDTHADEGPALNDPLGGLDATLAAFKRELGPVWADTVVLVVTEFGRTVRLNGTRGTDHGTGAVAFLAGGRVKGGRVLADWPGLKTENLHEGRDLKPTTDLRAVIKGVAVELYDLSPAVLASQVFPDSAKVAPLPGVLT